MLSQVTIFAGQLITGRVLSDVQLTERDALAVLPHASLANQVLVWVRSQPLLPTVPEVGVGVKVPQMSVAVAVPKAASMTAAVGLQPNVVVDPVAVITGTMLSNVQLTVRDALAVLLQASVAVHVLV